jgi:hypothetical protein
MFHRATTVWLWTNRPARKVTHMIHNFVARARLARPVETPSETGQGLAEYGLILSLIAVVARRLTALGEHLGDAERPRGQPLTAR